MAVEQLLDIIEVLFFIFTFQSVEIVFLGHLLLYEVIREHSLPIPLQFLILDLNEILITRRCITLMILRNILLTRELQLFFRADVHPGQIRILLLQIRWRLVEC